MKSIGSTIFSDTDRSSSFTGSSGTRLFTFRLKSRHKRFLTVSVCASNFKTKLNGLQQLLGACSLETAPSATHSFTFNFTKSTILVLQLLLDQIHRDGIL